MHVRTLKFEVAVCVMVTPFLAINPTPELDDSAGGAMASDVQPITHSRQSRHHLPFLYGSSSNLERDQRIAACHPRHNESRGLRSIRSTVGSDSA